MGIGRILRAAGACRFAAITALALVSGCSVFGGGDSQSLAPISRPNDSAMAATGAGEGATGSGASFGGASGQSAESDVRPLPDAAQAPTKTHVVGQGENLFRIALNNGLTTEQLAAFNAIPEPYVIFPGQELILPGGPAAPTPVLQAGAAERRALPDLRAPETLPEPRSRGFATARTGDDGAPGFAMPVVEGRIVARSRELPSGGSTPGWTIAVQSGADVSAAADGLVMYAGDGVPGFGNLVLIRHDNHWVTAYGYNDLILIEQGDEVVAGQRIAQAPNRRRGQQAEIYFEIRNGVTPVDPGEYLSEGSAANTGSAQ